MNGVLGYSITEEAIDVLTELVNIGVGRAAASLSELIGERIELAVPRLRLEKAEEQAARSLGQHHGQSTVVLQDFHGHFAGRSALVFPAESGLVLASLLSGADETTSELDLELQGLLLEVGNILLNAVMGTFSNETHCALEYTLPRLLTERESLSGVLHGATTDEDDLLVADVQFHVKHREICGSVVIVFTCGSVMKLLQLVKPEVMAS
ncbi:chemotaxis protein CheC [bacterium]|nr:chemotaxis protein CheC [bacterium]